MKSRNPQLLDKKALQDWIGRPVWYMSTTDLNDFGWAFVDPATYEVDKYTGFRPGHLILIKPGPSYKTHYSWLGVEVFDRPAVKRLCAYCDNWVRATPGQEAAHCSCHTQDAPRCRFDNDFAPFRAQAFYRDRDFTLKTWKRMVSLVGVDLAAVPMDGGEA